VNDISVAEKIDSYVIVGERFETEEAYWRKKATECTEIARGFDNANKNLKSNLQLAMERLNVKEIFGVDYRFKECSCKKRLIVESISQLPKDYTIVTTEADADKLRIDLEKGLKVPGAKLEGGTCIKKFRNRKA